MDRETKEGTVNDTQSGWVRYQPHLVWSINFISSGTNQAVTDENQGYRQGIARVTNIVMS